MTPPAFPEAGPLGPDPAPVSLALEGLPPGGPGALVGPPGGEDLSLRALLRHALRPWDARYSPYREEPWWRVAWADLGAGLLVATVALPLAVGIALASGLAPAQGVLAGVVAGLVGAWLGGSRWQSYGPSPALVPPCAALVAAHGPGFLASCGLGAGLMLLAAGRLGLGPLLARIPRPLRQGFALSVAILLATKAWGWAWAGGAGWPLALPCLAALLASDRWWPRVPTPALVLGGAWLWQLGPWAVPGLPSVASLLPGPAWSLASPSGGLSALAWPPAASWGAFVGGAASLAVVVALESVLSAHQMHDLTKDRMLPEDGRELLAQGMGLAANACLGAAPSSGSLPRAVLNWREGAKTPVSSVSKALAMAAALPWLPAVLGALPLAALGALLLALAWKMLPCLEPQALAQEALWVLGAAGACVGLGLAWGLLLTWGAWLAWGWGTGRGR